MSRNEVFSLKVGDSAPEVDVTITQESTGAALDISAATEALFFMKKKSDGTIKINGVAADIYDGVNGKLKYSWTGSDTDTEGIYLSEFKITLASGKIVRMPQKGHIAVIIKRVIA